MDGIQDSDEKGIADVNITLNETGATTTTDENGFYQFCGLNSGEYSITVDKDTLPYGYKITKQNSGADDTNDSDINASTGESDKVVINENNNTTLDGGAYPTYCLGDMVWDDKNANGIQD
jgi:serine-aspartate repeat-containing protein C/D/E